MRGLVTELLAWIFGSKADAGIAAAAAANQGFDRLLARMDARLTLTERRVDECDEDRADLRVEVGGLKIKVAECEEDRNELRQMITELDQRTQ